VAIANAIVIKKKLTFFVDIDFRAFAQVYAVREKTKLSFLTVACVLDVEPRVV
jgi:hypothetical protein